MSAVFVWPVRVYYEDTDSGGVVYHANYLKFMERARSEWLRAAGFEQDRLLAAERLLFAVRSVQLEYRAPARFNDLLQVTTRVSALRGASLSFVQAIRRGDALLAEGSVKVVCIDADSFAPRRVPRSVVEALAEEIA